ncbi:ABC transporter permease [Actinomyces sp. 186855]|nr:ABC transporter permease [Actinomyces sp. AC-20-1]MCL3789048.1 ABC transporter permease [Actinomyces sp. 187325]MCL3791437.1 ABC transporter permease [Actinomyces sp. 186855]MCL3794032.1 ABC transporter permease [Actinomyces sp. 217892]
MSAALDRESRLAQEPFRPAAPRVGLLTGTRASLLDIWGRRDLLSRLTRREIRARYKDSALGIVWSLIKPLVSLLIYVLVIGKVMGAERAIPSFAIYVFTGLTAWQLFSDILSTSTGSVVGNSGIIKKIQLPREIFPLSSVGAALFNFSTQFLVLLAATLLIDPPAVGVSLLYLPLGLLVLVTWGTAIGLVLAATNVYLRDIQYLIEVVLLVGMWASPIVYSWTMVTSITSRLPLVQELYLANPVTLAIMGFQRTMWAAGAGLETAPHLGARLLVSLAVGLVLLALAQRVFAVLQRNFAQEL